MKKKILITGGLGYIGSHAVVAFEEAGYETVLLDNLSNSCVTTMRNIQNLLGYKPKYYECDLRDRKSVFAVFEENNFDGVLHFAGAKAVGESCENPIYYFQNNISGSLFLFEAMEKFGVKNIIFSSSATVYKNNQDSDFTSPLVCGEKQTSPLACGALSSKEEIRDFSSHLSPLEEREQEKGICETDVLGTTNPYGTTKMLLEKILEDLSEFSGFNVINLRYFNPIGAHPSGQLGENPEGIPNNLLPFIMKVATGELKELQIFGNDYDTIDGTGVRDYIDVNDLVEGHLLAYKKLGNLTSPQPCGALSSKEEIKDFSSHLSPLEERGKNTGFCDVYNLGVGKGISVLEMLKLSEKITGKSIAYKIVERRKGDIGEVYCSPNKARKELGFEAKISLEESLKNSWRFYNK